MNREVPFGYTHDYQKEMDESLAVWVDKCERFYPTQRVVFITKEEASDAELPSPYTDLYTFIKEMAIYCGAFKKDKREWRHAARFYALLFNAGRISGQREAGHRLDS